MKEEMRTIGYLVPEVQKARYAAALPLRPRCLGRDRAVRMRQERAADRLRRRKIPHQRALRRVRRRASGGVRRGPAGSDGEGIGLACPETSELCCFIGEEYAVERALEQLQITAEKQSAQGDAPEAFTDTVIMYEVLSELKEIAARPRGITCACGSERYRMQVRPAAVDLICEDCGAKLRIGAATDEDLDRLCCHMTLQIPGKKG